MNQKISLHFANFLDPALNPGGQKLASLLNEILSLPVTFSGSQVIDHRLADHYDLAFLCGLPYSVLHDTEQNLQPLCAPLYEDERITQLPVYFADVMVHRDNTSLYGIDDLQNTHCVFNHRVSLSGYLALAAALHDRQLDFSFFSSCTATGSHAQSLEHIQDKQADFAAIDSHVLALREDLDWARRAFSLGPYPAPPLVASTRIASDLRQSLVSILTSLHLHSDGKDVLTALKISRFVAVDNAYYDSIRTLSQRHSLGYECFHEQNYTHS